MYTKRWIVGGTCALLLAGTASYAQQGDWPERGEDKPRVEGQRRGGQDATGRENTEGRRGHRPPPLEDIIERFDANGDGKLQQSEAPDRFPAQAFEHLDMNDDGAIDLSEAKQGRAMREARGEGRMPGGDKGVGADGDDRRRPRGDVEQGDRPQRGDRAERGDRLGRGGRDGKPRMEQVIARLDANDDGLLQKNEVPEQMLQLFARMDTNDDGVIDSAESESVQARRRGNDGGEKPRGPRGQRKPGGDGEGHPEKPDKP